jgi:demethylmenaquinone methyltransferase/2-methoxy-6-polyprenyl-1,4-benzoquinol methylase
MQGKDKDGMEEVADFGFREVRAADKSRLVRGVFDSVAGRYDLMNDLMSLGIHRAWKAEFIGWLAPRADMHLLDVAGGTGDIAFRFLEKGGGKVTVCDLTEEMVLIGRDRAVDRGILRGCRGAARPETRRPVPLPGVQPSGMALAGAALRPLFLFRAAGAGAVGGWRPRII